MFHHIAISSKNGTTVGPSLKLEHQGGGGGGAQN